MKTRKEPMTRADGRNRLIPHFLIFLFLLVGLFLQEHYIGPMYKADDKRFKTLNDTWDIPKMKLTAYIVEARDLYVGPKSQISCSVRLERRVFG